MTDQTAEDMQRLREQLSENDNYHYAKLYDAMINTLQKQRNQAKSPEKIADTIIQALTDEHPGIRYTIGADVIGLSTMRKIAPDSVGDAILKRILGLK